MQNAFDPRSFLLQAERTMLPVYAGVARRSATGKLSSLLSAFMLDKMLDYKAAQEMFFPFAPRFDFERFAALNGEVTHQAVSSWMLLCDLLSRDPAAGRLALQHLEEFQRVTTTPFPIAQTPRECVAQFGIVKLYRYLPMPGVISGGIPLLLSYAIMNTPGILDLRRGGSLIERLVREGFIVYLIDWGHPTASESGWSFETYALELLPKIVARVKELSNSKELSILGWCLGALISVIYASMLPDEGLRNLIILTAPLDFSCEGLTFKNLLERVDVEKVLRAYGGNMPAWLINEGAQGLSPVDNTYGSLLALVRSLGNPDAVDRWHAMDTWLRLKVPMAGGAFRQLASLYRDNLLTTDRLVMAGRVVDLRNVQASVRAIVAKGDRITPDWQTRIGVKKMTGSPDVSLAEVEGGHIGGIVGPQAQQKVWPEMVAWLAERSN